MKPADSLVMLDAVIFKCNPQFFTVAVEFHAGISRTTEPIGLPGGETPAKHLFKVDPANTLTKSVRTLRAPLTPFNRSLITLLDIIRLRPKAMSRIAFPFKLCMGIDVSCRQTLPASSPCEFLHEVDLSAGIGG